MNKLRDYVLAAALSLNLGCGSNLSQKEISQNLVNSLTRTEMGMFRQQGLELERRVNGETSANIWTTIDGRAGLEEKDDIVDMVAELFRNDTNYFNSFCSHPVNNIEIIIDGPSSKIGYVPFDTSVIVLSNEHLEEMLNDENNYMRAFLMIHEYGHVQLWVLDKDEHMMNAELPSMVVESLNAIRIYGYERFKAEYPHPFKSDGFDRLEFLIGLASKAAARMSIKQLITGIFEGRITWDDDREPLQKLEQFAGMYFAEEANGEQGFDNAARDAGLMYRGRELRLLDIRREAYTNSFH